VALAAANANLQEQVLVDLSLWLSRVLQYSAAHPACAQLCEKTHRTLTRALSQRAPLSFGVLKDDVLVDGEPARHPVVRTRVAPYLHARGVLLLRFISGTTQQELTNFVELITLPEQTVFDRGGLLRLSIERGISHIQVEEIAHDISNEEREAQRRRNKLRTFFREMLRNVLARRPQDLADHLLELLEHPEIAVTILEEDAAGITEAVAGLALMTRQEQQRSGLDLLVKLVPIVLALSPMSRDRLLIGLPALAGDFRGALAWVIDAFSSEQIAKLALPAVRAHAADLDSVLYALSVAVPHDGTRWSALRWLALRLFDLAGDDAANAETLATLAAPVPEYHSFRRERECLRESAARAHARRVELFAAQRAPLPELDESQKRFDGRRSVYELVRMAMRTRGFDKLCAKLPASAAMLSNDRTSDGIQGMLRALGKPSRPEWKDVCTRTRGQVAAAAANMVLSDLDAASSTAEGGDLEAMTSTVAMLAISAPAAVLDRLDASESRKFRRILLDALGAAGAAILPHVRPRLRSPTWYVVRNAVLIVARCGGTGADLQMVARHPNEKVRREVVRLLRSVPQDATVMDVVVDYLTDPSPEISQHAPMLLRGELAGPKAIERLEKIAGDEQQPEDLRRRVIHALGRSPREEAAQALLRVLQPKGLLDVGSGALRDTAAEALRHSPAPNAPDCFGEGLRSSMWRVRKACERAAGKG
jgi:hypothetical protein